MSRNAERNPIQMAKATGPVTGNSCSDSAGANSSRANDGKKTDSTVPNTVALPSRRSKLNSVCERVT